MPRNACVFSSRSSVVQVAERDCGGFRQKRSETLAPELVAHQRKRSAGEPVKRMFGRKDAGALGVGSRELDGGFHPFASRRSEERLRQTATRALAQLLRQFSGQIRNVRLNHRRTTALQFALQCPHHRRMIVTDIVNAVTGEKIENAPSVVGEQFHSQAPLVANIHLQQIEKPHPFRVYPLGIALRRVCGLFDLDRAIAIRSLRWKSTG